MEIPHYGKKLLEYGIFSPDILAMAKREDLFMNTQHRWGALTVSPTFWSFVEDNLLPDLSLTSDEFWAGLETLVSNLGPKNRALLLKREDLQKRIDVWASAQNGGSVEFSEQKKFLSDIGYLVPMGAPFSIETQNVDPEISSIAGPQLVVPVMNARFALNAANARWRSLYDAVYGTDVVGHPEQGSGYDTKHGEKVVAWVSEFLDQAVPLVSGNHADVVAYSLVEGVFTARVADKDVGLKDPNGFVGTRNDQGQTGYVLRHNGLHLELLIDASHPIGKTSQSGLCDVILESALTAIHDCEDSVAAVDAADKVLAYTNWLGLMRGDLVESFEKNGATITRSLETDRDIVAADGSLITLPGRTVALVRNVGHLMTTDAVLYEGVEIPEGILDALVTVTCALHDLGKSTGLRNSRTGSVYIVKPKMHGPEEVAFADTLFASVETILGLAPNTIKIGVMDEERRTSANLSECIRQVKSRIAFINTGFLDRTGDEIHTWMSLGPVIPKEQMRSAAWISAYEDGNVDAGLATGMMGKGQIGKGMWARPDDMADMLLEKIGHPLSGANTAWVPSPTAATLHATHYHRVDVPTRMEELRNRTPASLEALLTPPVMQNARPDADAIQMQIDNNCQSILGYVVRWVNQGVGCSKVPDIHDVALMEDRATLRISSQLLANWLIHGVISEAAVDESLKKMALKVDAQNSGDPTYSPMSPKFDGQAFAAARDLILQGATQPSGYTEPLLHAYRKKVKQCQGN